MESDVRAAVEYGGSQAQTSPLRLLMTMGDVLCEELEDLVHFSVTDLPARGYVVMEEIRRQGKLCDVTLKVKVTSSWLESAVSCWEANDMLTTC